MNATLTDMIKKHEGLRLMPYRDTTGHLTIGYGRCLACEGISLDEASLMLDNDISKFVRALGEYSWYRNAPVDVQNVLVDMAFNLGVVGLLKFTTFLEYIRKGNFADAATDLLATEWARQLRSRSRDAAAILTRAAGSSSSSPDLSLDNEVKNG